MCTGLPKPPNDPGQLVGSHLDEMKDGRFSQFAKMGQDGAASDDPTLDMMRQEVNAAIFSTPPPGAQQDPIVSNSLPASGK